MDIQVGKKTMEINLLSKEGNAVKIDMDGTEYNVDIAMLLNGTYSILKDGISYNAEVFRGENGKHYRVNVNYSTYNIDMLDSQAKYMRLRKHNTANEEEHSHITAPMPCKIVKIHHSAGERLHKGDTVLTIEAMKMQSNLKVCDDCVIEEILVSEGDSVRVDQLLVKLNYECQ